MQPQGVIIVSAPLGVFLGVLQKADGSLVGLWSKQRHVHPHTPSVACAFSTTQEALQVAGQLNPPPEGATFNWVEVTEDESGRLWATQDAVQAAGFDSWLTWETHTSNRLPI